MLPGERPRSVKLWLGRNGSKNVEEEWRVATGHY